MKKLFKLFFLAIAIIALCMPLKVQAASFNMNVTANKQYVEPGKTVDINLRVANIDVEGPGIDTVEATLEYDRNIFEEVQQSNIQSVNNWSITYNNEDTEQNGKLLAVIIQDGVKEDQDIGKITLKVKNGVEYAKTTIKLKNITTNDGEQLINETDKEIVLEVGNKTQNSTGDGGSQNTTNNRGEQQDNLSSGRLPQTGIMSGIIIVAVIALISFAVIIYKRYRDIEK